MALLADSTVASILLRAGCDTSTHRALNGVQRASTTHASAHTLCLGSYLLDASGHDEGTNDEATLRRTGPGMRGNSNLTRVQSRGAREGDLPLDGQDRIRT